jgi:spore germination cell wall hydrolase CwlJ-like protein
MSLRFLQACFLLLLLFFTCPLHAAAVDGKQPGEQIIYTVAPGDNLYDIGIKYGLAHSDIIKANRLKDTIIHAGQKLFIPLKSNSAPQVSRSGERFAISEINLLARLIEAEAGSESYPAKVAVGAVVLNRVKSPIFPDSISRVINQSHQGTYQFSPVYNGSINRPASTVSAGAAREALDGSDPSGGALFFFTTGAADGHLKTRPVSKIIGKLTFAT